MADLSLSRLPWKAQLGVFLFVAATAAGAFYYFVELPMQADIATRERELATLDTRLDKARNTARQLVEFRRRVAELQSELESRRLILPEEKDAGDLLRRVQTLAAQSNLTVRGFRPQATNRKELHEEWPIELELEGTYHEFGRFLDSVSKFPRIINVGALDVRSSKVATAVTSIEVKCTATTFVLLDGPAPAPVKKGATAKSAPSKTE